jgi:hypothetical protein
MSRDSPISSSLSRPSSQDERIVQAGDEQDILHAKRHQVVKTLKRFACIQNEFAAAPRRHKSLLSIWKKAGWM